LIDQLQLADKKARQNGGSPLGGSDDKYSLSDRIDFTGKLLHQYGAAGGNAWLLTPIRC